MDNEPFYTPDDAGSIARVLHRSGQWDQSLAVLTADALAARAEILVDRNWWRLDGGDEAEEAVAALYPVDPALAGHLGAQLSYTRLLFDLGPLPGDRQRARDGFTTAAADARLAGWATFWLGVLTENVDGDLTSAAAAYQQALAHALQQGDTLLESYAVRHIGDHVMKQDRDEGLAQLRRSYHLRAALGARPQTAAAALTLAGELDPGPEADQLREVAGLTARDLRLTWVLASLEGSDGSR